MASSKAKTVEEYLSELPEERRAVVSAVREVILENLPEGYAEVMNWEMISYEIPLERYPNTYNGQPLGCAALAAQKNYYSLYTVCEYSDPTRKKKLEEAFAKAGKKLDMGKSCIRFKKLDDLPLDVIGEIIASATVKDMIAIYEKSRKK